MKYLFFFSRNNNFYQSKEGESPTFSGFTDQASSFYANPGEILWIWIMNDENVKFRF